MTYEHLSIDAENLADTIGNISSVYDAAAEITYHFRQQQEAHEAAKTPLENPLGMLEDAKFLCQQILDALDGCPVKMTAKKLEYILAKANGDMAAAADLVNEQVYDALNK